MPAPYAAVRTIAMLADSVTADLLLTTAGTDYVYNTPCAQLVFIVVSTPLGRCAANPTLGVDWAGVKTLADAIKAFYAALAPWVARGRVANVVVTGEEIQGGRYNFNIDFTDPRDTQTQQPRVARSIQF